MLPALVEGCFLANSVRAPVAARRTGEPIVEPVLLLLQAMLVLLVLLVLLLHAMLVLLVLLAGCGDERLPSPLLRGVSGRFVALLRVDLDDAERGRCPTDSLLAWRRAVALPDVTLAIASAPAATGVAQAVGVNFVFASPTQARVESTAALFCFARKPGRNVIFACPDGEHENSATGWNDSVTGLPAARR